MSFGGQIRVASQHINTLIRDNPWVPGPLRWLYVDMNSFFASVEQYDHPRWRGKPMIVVPMMTDATCAIAASYEAKRHGIKTGTPVWEARQKCPGLIMVMARHQRYVEVHEQVAAVIGRVLPVLARCSIDEYACQLMNNENSPDRARALALTIKAELAREFSDCLRCSIGIAPGRWLAKVGSDVQKPDGLTILESSDLPGPLLNMKLTGLCGIGANMAMRLQLAGIHTVEKLYNTPPKLLRKIWRSVDGERFWYRLHGYPIPENDEHDKTMVGHSRVLDPKLRPPHLARLVARRLLCKAATRLRRYGLTSAFIALSVRDPVRGRWANARHTTRSDDSFFFLEELQTLWQQMIIELRPTQIKKISIVFASLEAKQTISDLYASPQKVRRSNILPTLDQLNRKWGRDTVTIGFLPPDRIETKIAFARIPEMEEFVE